MIRVRIQIDIPGDEITIDLAPRLIKMSSHPAKLAEAELDRAVADARTWLHARIPTSEAPDA